jgi:hypothetical protein
MFYWSLSKLFVKKNNFLKQENSTLNLKIKDLENKLSEELQSYKDMKLEYELTLINLNTKMFEIQAENIILKKKIDKLEKLPIKKSYFW